MSNDTTWLDFLGARGAVFSRDGDVEGFGSAQEELRLALQSVALVPLTQLGVVRVSGRDALSFLQAQLTSELRDISAEKAGLSGYCTPQGRLLATPLVLMHGGYYLLIVPRVLAVPLAARLVRYVFRAQVKVDDASSALLLLGLVGPGGVAALQQAFERAPRRPLETMRLADASAVGLPQQRLLLICEAEHAEALWTRLSAGTAAAGPAVWELLGIRAGIAQILPATQELFLPQMLDLERLRAVSFSKGCYPGQEIVARTEYLGDLKRRLYRGSSAASARPGDALYSEGASGTAVGTIVNAAPSPVGGVELLAVVQRDAAQRDAAQRLLRLGSGGGPAVTLEPLTAIATASLEGAD